MRTLTKKIDEIPLIVIGGVLVIVFYCVCTFISAGLFPTNWNPVTTWLSDFGNSTYNPNGAIWYNTGCILTGTSMVLFFFGFKLWYIDKKPLKILIILSQIVGFIDAFGLIMIGVYSEDSMAEHVFWSDFFFKTNLGVLLLISLWMLKMPKASKIIPIYGFVNAIVNLLFAFTSSAMVPLLEWVTVFTALGFVFIITYTSYKIEQFDKNSIKV